MLEMINAVRKVVGKGARVILKSFDDIAINPKELWGKTKKEVKDILGKDWSEGKYGSSGTGWKFIKGDKSIFYNPSSSAHGGAEYWGFSSGKLGKNKIVNPSSYKHRVGDGAKIYNKNDGSILNLK